jgi:heparin/heparan-sulfate lyase
VYGRSDWSDAATWFRFECGDYWNGHQHYEAGNFEIYRYAPLATESGEYTDYVSSHAVNWLIRTIAHNCILVYQPGEKWSRQRDGGRNQYANDGGQTKKWEWPVDTLQIWKQRREQFERGNIVAYENRPELLYVAGDCTMAYAPSKLSLWTRQIVFLRPHAFVIYDRVISTRPEYEKTWLLHCRNEPRIDGDTATISQGKGTLMVRTLLPEKASIRAIEGYAYHGQTFNEARSALTDVANRWRIEVSPSVPQAEDRFVHVLFTDQPLPTKLIKEGDRIGAIVGDCEIVFTGDIGGQITMGGKTLVLRPAVIRGQYE